MKLVGTCPPKLLDNSTNKMINSIPKINPNQPYLAVT
jgi:hypothetical protein